MSVHACVAYHGVDIVVAEEEAGLPHSVTGQRRYTCAACEAVLTLRRTRHKRYVVSAFFAHQSTGDGCTGGGLETQAHLQCKYYLKEFVGHYGFCLERCRVCMEKRLSIETEATDLVQIEQTARVEGRRYRYDVLVSRAGRPRVAVEVVHTHASGAKKVEDTRGCGVALVEVHTSTVLRRVELLRRAKAAGASVELANALVVWGTCGRCERRGRRREEDEREQAQAQAQARAQAQGAADQEERARRAERQAERKASAQKSEPAMLERAKFKARAERWIDSWFRLVVVVSEQDAAIAEEHWRLWGERKRGEELRQHRKLQRKAFRQAEDAEEACCRLREQRAPYAKTNFKCVECDRWRAAPDLRHVQGGKWHPSQYRDLHAWHVDNGRAVPETARCCSACVIECPKCGEWYPQQGALRFGLCRECNMAFAKAWH